MIISLAVAIVFGIVLAATRFSRYTYAIGSNQEAARRTSIAVDRHLIKVYGLAGLLTGLAGFMNVARFSTTTIGGHDTDNLQAIAAVVISGTSLFGGIGTVLRIRLPGVHPRSAAERLRDRRRTAVLAAQVAIGAVLIGAVYLDQLRRRSQRHSEPARTQRSPMPFTSRGRRWRCLLAATLTLAAGVLSPAATMTETTEEEVAAARS